MLFLVAAKGLSLNPPDHLLFERITFDGSKYRKFPPEKHFSEVVKKKCVKIVFLFKNTGFKIFHHPSDCF